MSNRGTRAGLVPTQEHNPPFYNRRYSVDVHMLNVRQDESPSYDKEVRDINLLSDGSSPIVPDVPIRNFENEGPIQPEPAHSLPNPDRFKELNKWCRIPETEDTFLNLPGSSLTNKDFCAILDLGAKSWFPDNVLDMALELLSMEMNCEGRGIAIAPSMISTILFRAGNNGDADGDNYACYKEEKARFANKRWIFLPVNDGMAAEEFTYGRGGVHWSMVVIDRQHQSAHYVDSLMVKEENYQHLAKCIAQGVGNILGEEYRFIVEENTPNQLLHNFREDFEAVDLGPCGPFVYELVIRIIESIKMYQDYEQEDACEIHFPPGYGMTKYWRVSSLATRRAIWTNIGKYRANQIAELAEKAAIEHDRKAFES